MIGKAYKERPNVKSIVLSEACKKARRVPERIRFIDKRFAGSARSAKPNLIHGMAFYYSFLSVLQERVNLPF